MVNILIYLIFNIYRYFMKKFFILLFFFGISNVYAESGKYTASAVCDYNKSEIDSNNKTIISMYFYCISTVIKSNSDLFKVGENAFFEGIANIQKSSKGMDLQSFNTSTLSTNSDDKIFSENIRRAGDIKKGGAGISKTVGGTGKYAGITGECEYTVNYLPKNKASTIFECSYTK